MKPQTFMARVVSSGPVAGPYRAAKFSLTSSQSIDFSAGQYVVFHVPAPKLRHTLSITSLPSNAHSIEVLQGIVEGGVGSAWIKQLKPGDEVSFIGPLGFFTVRNQPVRKVFVATGCGIAPLRAMIGDYLLRGTAVPVELWWGIRYEEHLFWHNYWKLLNTQYPSFRYTILISRPTSAWNGLTGRVTDYVATMVSRGPAEYYLCGSRQMIEDMKAKLGENGVPKEAIFNETFFSEKT